MKNVLEYLENTALKYPDKKGAVDDKEECSYEQLLLISQALGIRLSKEMLKGRGVAVLQKKSVKTLQLFMGTVYAGGFYSLIDPDFPDQRITDMLSVLKPAVVITASQQVERLKNAGYEGKILIAEELFEDVKNDLTGDGQHILPETLSEIRKKHDPDMPLYCNFTSGSTGVPKGVLVSHGSVIGFIDEFTELFDITGEDVIGNQAPFDFDVSIKDIFSALKTGATLIIIPTAFFRFPNSVMDMLCDHGVTTLIWAVSALVLINRLHEFMYKVPPKINKVLFSGEQMPVKHLCDWMDQYPDASFVNLYGPTEITCNCTYYRITERPDPEKGIPIGTAYPGKQIYLLDDEDGIIDAGTQEKEGELCVTGAGLAIGYYNNSEATDKAFIYYDIPGKGKERMYRTGDLAFYRDGLLYFAGRKDFQIKHNGHRIELEEIERHVNSVEGVEQSCCLYDEKRYRITVFYVGSAGKKEIVASLKGRLPEYMIPSAFKQVESFSLTKNGKTDRRALAALL